MKRRPCARMRCTNRTDNVRVTPGALMTYCRDCAPIVACHRARIVLQYRGTVREASSSDGWPQRLIGAK